jgi:UDP-glucose 4-epimerase
MDLAEAHVAAINLLANSDVKFEAVNIGTGNGNSVQEVIDTFENVTGMKVPYKFGPRRSGDLVRIWSDTNYAEQILGWKSKRSLDDCMRDAWNWQKSLYYSTYFTYFTLRAPSRG